MASVLKWNGKLMQKEIERATEAGLVRAATFYHMKCREAVSIPNTGVSVPVKHQTPGGNKKSRTIYPNPSKPGEPPRLRTGWGARHIVKEFDRTQMAARVGIMENAIYMLWLELGTRRIQRRPWLVATLMKNREMIGKLAVTGE